MMDPPYAATCTIYSAKHAATVGLAAPNAAISAAWNMAASALSTNVAETASAQEAAAAEGRATVTETAEVAEGGSTPEAMRELRAEVLIPLLLQAAQRKKQAQETRGEGDETQQDARQEAEAGRNEGWDVTARGEGAGEAMREVEGERRNGVREHGEKAEIYGRGVSAARCLKFVRITDVTETDQSTANRHHNSEADGRGGGCTNRSVQDISSTKVKNKYHNEGKNDAYRSGPDKGFVRLVDVFEDESAVHMVMEHCEGGDLFEHVARCNSQQLWQGCTRWE
ncbi:unnamed protein product [Closterium sp. NIES-64]|nr:unnamed protein product [Closterium sp. NIES-64]